MRKKSTSKVNKYNYRLKYDKFNADIRTRMEEVYYIWDHISKEFARDILKKMYHGEFIELKKSYGNMSTKEIEDRCFCIVGKINTKFTVKEKKDNTVKLPVNSHNDSDEKQDEYGGLLAKVYKNK
jgi:hypothetical protein